MWSGMTVVVRMLLHRSVFSDLLTLLLFPKKRIKYLTERINRA